MSFTLQQLEKSTKYQSIKSQYNVGGGVSGFWSWLLGLSANASTEHSEVHEAFNEISSSQVVNGTAHIQLECTGQYPGVQVSASGYVLVLQITDNQGNNIHIVSNGNPTGDTGAQDQNGNAIPTRNNTTTMTF